MTARTTLAVRRLLTGIAYSLGPLLFVLSALPASAIQQIGYQSIIDFDEFDPGTTVITYGYNHFTITGGVVQAGVRNFPRIRRPMSTTAGSLRRRQATGTVSMGLTAGRSSARS